MNIFSEPRSRLTEGPVWNPHDNSLSFVDILEGALFIHRNLQDGLRFEKYVLSERLGAALPVAADSYLVLIKEGIFHFKPPSELRLVARYPLQRSDLRPNDAKIGPDGALWFSLMAEGHGRGQGSLWKYDGKRHTLLLGDLTIPNGLDWSDDCFFFVNGPTSKITGYHLDSSGELGEKFSVSTAETPDGLTLDSQGRIWVANWGSEQVTEIDLARDDWRLEHPLDFRFPTSIAITGGNHPQRFVTVACEMCFSTQDGELGHQHSGAVLVTSSQAAGRKPYTLGFALAG